MTGSFQKLNVLVVDDNYHMCRIVESILRGFGVGQIKTVQDVDAGENELRSHHVDIAIVDYLMKPKTGLELSKFVRQDSGSKNIYLPIILMTSFTELWRINEAKNAGINAILAKPISPIELYKRLAYVIERPRQFVKVDGYIGPDRRVDTKGMYDGDERRETQEV